MREKKAIERKNRKNEKNLCRNIAILKYDLYSCSQRTERLSLCQKLLFQLWLIPQETSPLLCLHLKNTGTKPVLLENVTTSCNCTAVKYSRQPILPGKTTYLTVYYNGKNYDAGHFKKSIDINSTAENSTLRLFISGTTTK